MQFSGNHHPSLLLPAGIVRWSTQLQEDSTSGKRTEKLNSSNVTAYVQLVSRPGLKLGRSVGHSLGSGSILSSVKYRFFSLRNLQKSQLFYHIIDRNLWKF
jgi:hypothetical protein